MANDLEGVEICGENSQGIVAGIEIVDAGIGLPVMNLEVGVRQLRG